MLNTEDLFGIFTQCPSPSSLLPYLHMLMDPLVSALSGSQTLISQGLRTLELCVDNLQPDFLYDHIQPVRAELMQVGCMLLLCIYIHVALDDQIVIFIEWKRHWDFPPKVCDARISIYIHLSINNASIDTSILPRAFSGSRPSPPCTHANSSPIEKSCIEL